MTKLVTVLGSTGSIGRQALEVIAQSGGAFSLLGISGGRNTALLLSQAKTFRPRYVASELPLDPALLPEGTELLAGRDGLLALAG